MSFSAPASWQAIQAELRRRIVERRWRPGELIPNEVELAEEFGCARATVSRALRELAAAGLIDRRRKAGTRVALTPVRKATLDIPITRLEVENRGGRYRHAVLLREKAIPPAPVAGKMGLAGAPRLLHLRTLHFSDDRPFLYEDRWVNPAAVPGIEHADLAAVSANEWLVQNAPFSHGDITFSAAAATRDEAEILGVETGAALFVVDRTTWNGEEAVTSVRLAYAPGFRIHTRL